MVIDIHTLVFKFGQLPIQFNFIITCKTLASAFSKTRLYFQYYTEKLAQ